MFKEVDEIIGKITISLGKGEFDIAHIIDGKKPGAAMYAGMVMSHSLNAKAKKDLNLALMRILKRRES